MFARNLQTISDDKLVDRLHDLVHREREMMLDILHHLNEVERRELHLRHGYRSMFAYCTGHLKYSESAAGRRIQAARVIRRYPGVADLVSGGDINLSTISKVANIALSRNDPTLFERIRGKTQDEAAAIAAEHCPRTRPRDRIRLVSVCGTPGPAPVSMQIPLAAAAPRRLSSPPRPVQALRNHSRGGNTTPVVDATPATNEEQQSTTDTTSGILQQTTTEATRVNAAEQNYLVQFVAGTDLMRAIEQVRSLLSFRLPADASMESVLAIVLDEFIERHSPDRRRERRKAKSAGRGNHKRTFEPEPLDRPRGGNREPAPAPRLLHGTPEPKPTRRSRHIPAAVRDEVLARDESRCSYVGLDGTRCTATRHLQIDHIMPIVRGGGSEVGNLRVLCGAHNRLEAERLLGAATMARYARRE